ncbi:MAG: acetate--CoA ligase family protein, partial [Rhodospirillales bacterium]|nr:acetate--CoA ligase family protein [Rhodospirillales bacterium]
MNFEEHAAKPLLKAAGITVPESRLARTADETAKAAQDLGAVVVKAQVPAGKRGKAGGIKTADSAEEARAAAEKIFGLEIAGHAVEKVLIEERSDIKREFYAAVLNDPATKGPLVMFSTEGGMDIEDVAEKTPGAIQQAKVDIRQGFGPQDAQEMR